MLSLLFLCKFAYQNTILWVSLKCKALDQLLKEFRFTLASKQLAVVSQTNLSRSSSTPSLKKSEEQLFEFLNSANPVTTTKGHTRNLSGPKTSTPRKTLPILSKASSVEKIPVGQISQEQKKDGDGMS